MTGEDAANIDRAKGRAIAAYDEAQARVRAAREKVARTREAMAAAGEAAGKQGSWPALMRSLTWPSSTEAIAELDALDNAISALEAARQDLRQLGLHPENW